MSPFKKVLYYGLLTISALILFFPIIVASMISFMDGAEILRGTFIPNSWKLDNYVQAFMSVPLLRYLWNSFQVSFLVMIGQLVIASLAAYAFVFIQFKGRNFLFFLFISTMMIPWEATMIPNYLTIQQLDWIDRLPALTIPFFATAFGTFLLRQHFKTIPYELIEAAQMEGLNRFQIYLRVVVPVSRISFVTLGAYAFLTTWNMYLWPLLVTNDEKAVRTVQIGLKQMQSQEISTAWGVVMAGAIVVVIPSLLLLFAGQKQLQKGLTQGAIK
ncbi:carbohydrate ABC transporter permease [Rubeoparvulum massiliense]|uniref:carbohydrate ABC transporter permease n=1 Tax=Rubeoparvulum massiliense TaxID=1631346 RepID=UPI00065E28FE|nr:carbohydrate ABC transporter permease [Rubeoparvulum massiliense]